MPKWLWIARERAALGTGLWHSLMCPFCSGYGKTRHQAPVTP